jgi:hypothetical protein
MNNIDSIKLVSWNRWDILIKKIYVYYFLLYNNNPPKWVIKLYNDHIAVLNGGIEEQTIFQTNNKENINEFINCFNNLIININNNGYNIKYPIPLSRNKTPLNGGHRIAIGSVMKLKLPYENINENVNLHFTSYCFQDRKSYETTMPKIVGKQLKNKLDDLQNDFVAMNMLLDGLPNRYRIGIFFDLDNFNEKQYIIKDFFDRNKVDIVYKKEVILTKSGIYKLIQHLYEDNKQVNINWKTTQVFKINPIKNKYKIIVTIFHCKNENTLSMLGKSNGKLKTELRKKLENHHRIHITDNDNDTKMISKLVFHKASIDFINIANVNEFQDLSNQLENYMKYISKLYHINNKLNKKKDKFLPLNEEQFKDMFCITSSFILSLYGIRKNNDIDFIYDTTLINTRLQTKLDMVSHNKYSCLFPNPIKNLIHNPKNYFYYLGMKCLNIELILEMKQKRAELPKDINDIKFIKNFKLYSYLKHMVTIITVSHVIPTAPDVSIIEKMLESVHNNIEGAQYMNHIIFIDTKTNNPLNKQFIKNMNKLRESRPNLFIIEIPNSGLKANYINGIKICKTPYLYFIEHDWIFNEKIPTTYFVNNMEKYNDINYIKLSKRKNMEKGGWDKILVHDNRFNQLVKTDSWSNHPHIVRHKKWLDDWLKIINPNKKAEKSYGIEDIMFQQYQNDIKNISFLKAHKNWGCYNWLSKTGLSPIRHLDGSQHYGDDELDGAPKVIKNKLLYHL